MIFKQWKLNLLFIQIFQPFWTSKALKSLPQIGILLSQIDSLWSVYLFSQLLLLPSAGNNPRLLPSLSFGLCETICVPSCCWKQCPQRHSMFQMPDLSIGKGYTTDLVLSLCYLNKDLLSEMSFHSENIFVLVAYPYPLQLKAHKASMSWPVKNPWQEVFYCVSMKLHTFKQKSLDLMKYKYS